MIFTQSQMKLEGDDLPFVAIIGTTSSKASSYAGLEAHLCDLLSGRESAVQVKTVEGREGVRLISIGSRSYTVIFTPLDRDAATCSSAVVRAIAWPEAGEAVDSAVGRYIVAPFGLKGRSGEPLDLAKDVTMIASAICRSSSCCFIYWREADALISPASFDRQAQALKERGQIPVTSWFRFEPSRSDSGVSAINTKGMKPFASRELAVIRMQDPAQLIDVAVQLAEFLVKRGGIINDGDALDFPNGLKLVATVRDGLIVASDAHVAA